MDEEKAEKFLSVDDRITAQGIEATHEMGSNHPAGIAKDEMTFDGSNAKTRHEHRGELLGIVDRLLGTTAIYAGRLGNAEARIDELLHDYNVVRRDLDSMTAHRNDLKTAYEKAAAELNAANAKLAGYEALGKLSPWFGGPYSGLTINDGMRDKVFAKYDHGLWSFAQLVSLVETVKADNKKVEAPRETVKADNKKVEAPRETVKADNKKVEALADKPMQILDDAQGYYTVDVPGFGSSVTVRKLLEHYHAQRATLRKLLEHYHAQRATIEMYQGTVARKDEKILEQSETLQRKNEKILEQAKEIKQLKEQNAGILAAGLIPLQALVSLPDGGVLRLGDLVVRYLTQKRVIRSFQIEVGALNGKLRAAQEDLGSAGRPGRHDPGP